MLYIASWLHVFFFALWGQGEGCVVSQLHTDPWTSRQLLQVPIGAFGGSQPSPLTTELTPPPQQLHFNPLILKYISRLNTMFVGELRLNDCSGIQYSIYCSFVFVALFSLKITLQFTINRMTLHWGKTRKVTLKVEEEWSC